MKLFLLLLLFSAAYASSFGYSRIELTRVWSIEAPEPGADISFEGMLIFNDSHQKVYLLQTEPEMEVVEDGNGSIRLIYNGTIDGTVQHLMGTTLVEVFYNTSLKDDPPLPDTELTHTELTEPSAGIRVQAEKLKGRTTLETIKNI
ncbi:TPA: hypothetical protein EYP38_02070, partial [Candidatus Micrarchaeota archaeon]|nr:hypothetical protein [Candidatus Micrarchaeota archaeon]